MGQHRNLPVLRRETILPPGTFELHSHRKLLRRRDGQAVRWKRLPGRGRIAGVCAGLAYRLGMRPWKVRLAFMAAFALGAVFYLLAVTFVPVRKRLPKDFDARTA